jgi:hypothetical protein
MARIQLRLTIIPEEQEYLAEVFVNLKRTDGGDEPIFAAIDTGAAVSLFPVRLLDQLAHRVINEKVLLQQAGIARQEFEAVEAMVTLFMEDLTGARTQEFEVKAWFANTLQPLIGFENILDSAVLHIDMLHTHSGYLEFADT